MRLLIERQPDDFCLVRAVGEIDFATVVDLDSTLRRVQADGHTHVLLDLWEVTFIDSVGIGVLLSAKRRAEKGTGGFATFAEPQGVVQTAFHHAGLDYVMPVYSSRDFAAGMLRSYPSGVHVNGNR
jgi:anti-anti-sigma factor